MKTKTCTKCKIEKLITEFNKDKSQKDELTSQCKDCRKEYMKKYNKKYNQSHKEERKEYRDSHKEEIAIRNKKHYQLNKKELVIKAKKYRKIHKEKFKLFRDSHKNEAKIYRQLHKKEANEYRKNRRETDVNFKIKDNLRTRIRGALKGNTKSLPAMFLIGCEVDYLMYHIQKQFTKGMTWDNWGRGDFGKKEWHIDHIKPCALFDLSKPSEQRKCFHYTNLQPLWAGDNWNKGTKYILPKLINRNKKL